MWCNDKAQLTQENLLERQLRAQGLLKQVQDVYDSYYEDKEASEKNFENWLVSQVNIKEPKIAKNNKGASTTPRSNENKSGSLSSLKYPESKSPNKITESSTKSKYKPKIITT